MMTKIQHLICAQLASFAFGVFLAVVIGAFRSLATGSADYTFWDVLLVMGIMQLFLFLSVIFYDRGAK